MLPSIFCVQMKENVKMDAGASMPASLSGLTEGLWFITLDPGASLGLDGGLEFGSFLGKLDLQSVCGAMEGVKVPGSQLTKGRDSVSQFPCV